MNFGQSPSPHPPKVWTPTDINALFTCGLRSAYDHDRVLRSVFRRDSTFSVVGVAAHELTRLAWTDHFEGVQESDLKSRLYEEWERLIQEGFKKLSEQWAPAIVPDPSNWPFYSLTRQRTLRRVTDEIGSRTARGSDEGVGQVRVERWINDTETGLGGIPDRVILTGAGFYVLDVKTGVSVDSITPSFRRQLLIYAHLVSTTTDEPVLGIGVIAAEGTTHWEEVDSNEVDGAVSEVVERIKDFSEAITRGSFDDLANPSLERCRYCPYRGVCRPFWQSDDEEWLDHRGVVGRVVSVLNPTSFAVEQVLPSAGAGQIVGISNTAHGVVEGDLVSVVDAFRRGNAVRGDWNTRVQVLGTTS